MPGMMDMLSGGGGGPMPGGMPGDMGGGMPAGAPGDPTQQLALSSLDKVGKGGPSQALKKVDEALGLAYKLIMSALPQISNINPKITKELHAVATKLQAMKIDVSKEMPPEPPPEMMMGMAGNPAGSPMGLPPGGMGGSPGGGM
jgi:hypothetical protein